MGSIDIPPFMREKMKQNVQTAASDTSSDIPPFLKKKEGLDTGASTVLDTPSTGSVQPISPSPLPIKNKPSFDPFDIASIFTTPTVKNLDPIELREFNSNRPGLTSPEKQTEVIKGIIEKRKNPAVKVSNAQAFLSDDLANNLPKDAGDIEAFKQKITLGVGADDSINLPAYFSKRNSDLDSQIKDLQNQQYIHDEVQPAFGLPAQYTVKRADNFDELQTKIDNLSQYKSHLNNSASTLAAYQAVGSVPIPTDKNPNTMKDYYRKVGLQVGKVTSPIATAIKEKQIETSLDANRHPELVDIENYRLESEGLAARQFAITADFNNGVIKPEEYNAQLNEIQLQRGRLFDLHPQAKKVAQSQAIGQLIQEQRAATAENNPKYKPLSVFHNIVSYSVSDDEIKSAATKLGLTEDEVKAQINNRDDIPGTSFLANVYNKFIVSSGETMISPLMSLATKGRLRTDEEVEAEKYSKNQKFQFNAQQATSQPNTVINTAAKRGTDDYLQEVANPAAGSHNWGTGTLNAVGDALGTLGQLWLATELTGGIADAAVGGVIGTEVVGVARTASALNEVKQLSAAQKALMGNMAGMVVTGYNDNKAAAKQFLPDEKSQQVYALTRSLETGLLFGLLGGGPQKLIANLAGKAESEAAAKTFAEMIPAEGIEALGQKEWSDYLRNNLAARIGLDAVKENTKATALMTLDEAVGIGTQAMFNPQSVDSKNLGHDLLNSAVHNFLTFAPISFFGAAVKGGHANQSGLEKEALYRMGKDPAQYAEYVNEQVKNGMPQADADRRIQLVNSMGKILQSGDVPADLSRSEKIEFANNLLHEKKLYDDIKNLSSKPLIELKDAEIKQLQERQKQILLNSDGVEKDAAGVPIIKSNEVIQNETANNSDQGTKVADSKAAENTAPISDGAQAEVATDKVEGNITKEAEDLLSSIDSGSKPAFVTKNLEKIAKENGVEVTEKSTPDEIVNSLKEKKNVAKKVEPTVEKLLDEYRNKIVLSEFPTDEEKLKFIAEQAQGISPTGDKISTDVDSWLSVVDAFGDKLVSKAVEMFPEEKLLKPETFKEGSPASSEAPPDASGKEVVTLSGLSDAERQDKIKRRIAETKSSDRQKEINTLMDSVDEYNKMPAGRLGKLNQNGLQLRNKINVRASELGLKFDAKSGVLRSEKNREVKRNYSDVGDRAIEESGVPLRDRPKETRDNFDRMLESGAFPNGYRLDNKKMSAAELDATIEDIIDGIPSARANKYLDSLDEGAKSGLYEYGDADRTIGLTLDQVTGTQKEVQGEIMPEEKLVDWLKEESDLTPEQEQIITDNIDNLLTEYEQERPIETETGVAETPQSVDAGTAQESSAAVEPNTADTGSAEKPAESVAPEPAKPELPKEKPATKTIAPPDVPPAEAAATEAFGPDKTVLTFKGLQEVADEFGLGNISSRDRKSDVKLMSEAQDLISKWVEKGNYAENAEELVQSGLQKKVLSDVERVVLQQHLANARSKAREIREGGGVLSADYNDAVREIARITNAATFTRSAAGATLRIGDKTASLTRYSVDDMMAAKSEGLGTDILTDKQKQDIQKQANDIEAKEKDFAAKSAAYEAKIAELKAELAIQDIKLKNAGESKGKSKHAAKKEHKDYVAERKSLIEKLKEAKEKEEKRIADKGIQQMGFGITLTKEMVGIMKDIVSSHVEEVGSNLKEVVARTLGEVKALFPDVNEADIRDVIAGKYNEPAKTKSELQRDLADIRDEQKLINKLSDLEAGVEPKEEKKKIQRNQQITELRRQINDFEKAAADAIREANKDPKKLEGLKKRYEKAAADIQERIAEGRFDPEHSSTWIEDVELKRKFPNEYKAALEAKKAVDNAKYQFEVEVLRDARSKHGKGKKFFDAIGDAVGTSKAIRAGIDLSSMFIQNIVPIISHPVDNVPNIGKAFVDMVSRRSFESRLAEWHNSKYWDLIQKSGLDVTEPKSFEAAKKEEAFNRNLLDRDIIINGKHYNIGKYTTAPFERHFTSLGNNIRVSAFLKIAEKMEREGKTIETHEKEFQDVARMLNTQTGRGTLPEFIQKSTSVVNSVFWSPRLMASRLNILGLGDLIHIPSAVTGGKRGFYAGLEGSVRKRAMLDTVKFISAIAGVYAAASYFLGAEADFDPRSVTFGDIKAPGSPISYNLAGGFSQYIRFFATEGSGTKIKGAVKEDISDAKGQGRGDLVTRFLRGKVTPIVGVGINVVSGKDFLGRPVDYGKEALSLVTPLSADGLWSDMKKDGVAEALLHGFIGATGVGVKDSRDYQRPAKAGNDRGRK